MLILRRRRCNEAGRRGGVAGLSNFLRECLGAGAWRPCLAVPENLMPEGAWGWCQMVLTAVVLGSTAWRRRCYAVVHDGKRGTLSSGKLIDDNLP